MTEDRSKTLVDRLHGIYNIPVNDGAGPLNGSMVFSRNYGDQGSLQGQAALTIQRLERGEHVEWGEINKIIMKLMEPDDPMNIGKKYVVPIRQEAAQRIYNLQMSLDPPPDLT